MLWLYLTPILIIALNWKITWWWVARPSSPVPVAPPKPRSRRSRRAILLDERWAASTKNDGNMGPWELFQLVIIQLQLFIKLLQVLEFFGESAFLICWKMLKGFFDFVFDILAGRWDQEPWCVFFFLASAGEENYHAVLPIMRPNTSSLEEHLCYWTWFRSQVYK